MKWWRLLGRLLIGGLFLYLSLDKIQHPRVFAEAILGYDILPPIAIPVLAVGLPWVEFFAGLFLLLGLLSRGSALLLLLMSLGFTAMISIALLRGLDISCGCFTEATWSVVNWRHLVFDFILVGIAGSLYKWGVGPLSLDRILLRPAESDDGQTTT